jgi:alpha-tubulin suppressor-like RCC1 family protein
MLRRALLTFTLATLTACAPEGNTENDGAAARLTGRLVTAAGAGAAGWAVRTAASAKAVVTGADGAFALPPLAPGAYVVHAAPPRSRDALAVPVIVRAGVRDLGELVLPAGLRVAATTEGAPAGATGRVFVDGGEVAAGDCAPGVFLDRLTPGDHAVRVECDTLPPATRQVTLRSGEIAAASFALAAPTLEAPTVGSAAWNDVLELRGTGLGYYAAEGAVELDAAPLAVAYWDDAGLGVRIPAGLSPGDHVLTVIVGERRFEFPLIITPTLVAAALTGDGRIVLDGVNFGAAAGVVLLGGVEAPVAAWSPTRVTANVSPTLAPGLTEVALTAVYMAHETRFVTVAPHITGLAPAVGHVGDAVVVNGAHLGASGTLRFGAGVTQATAWSPTAVTAVVPLGDPAGGVLTVTLTVNGLSATAPFTVLPSLPPPTGLTIVMGSGRTLSLAWIDNAATETGYEVERAAGGGGYATVATLAAGRTSWADAGAAVGVDYSYRVVARQGAIRSVGLPVAYRVLPATALSINGFTACALQWMQALCWGSNGNQQIHPVASSIVTQPTRVAVTAPPFANLIAGYFHVCGVDFGGALWCWGGNAEAELGQGYSGADVTTAVQVPGLPPAVTTSSGTRQTCVADAQGRLFCWGGNSYAQVGVGMVSTAVTWATQVTGVAGPVSAVAAGMGGTCAITRGTLYCWGSNSSGQAGTGNLVSPVAWPAALPATFFTSPVVEVAPGNAHTCARLADETVWCWGDNGVGQLGMGTVFRTAPKYSLYPRKVTDLTQPVRQILAGTSHTCARLADGAVLCWGLNNRGQLGTSASIETCPGFGSPACSSRPVPVALAAPAVEISLANDNTCARHADGSVGCWGRNANGQIGDGAPTTFVPQPAAVVFP